MWSSFNRFHFWIIMLRKIPALSTLRNIIFSKIFQVILLGIRTLHVILRYGLHLYDVCRESNGPTGRDSTSILEKRGPLVYYVELGFELTALIVDFVHHLHMLLWSNIFLSMASLVICMQLRYLFHEIQLRCKKHRNYLWVLNHMEQKWVARGGVVGAPQKFCLLIYFGKREKTISLEGDLAFKL